MKYAMQKYRVGLKCRLILLMTALFTLCLLEQLNAQTHYAVPMPGYSNRMSGPNVGSLSSELLGNSVNGLFSLFPELPVVPNIYSSGEPFPGFDMASMITGIRNNIQKNPVGNILNPEGDVSGLSINPFGLGNLFNPAMASGMPYFGLNYLLTGLPIMGLLGAGLSGAGISGIGFPGIGFPGIQPLGTGFSGIVGPWMRNPSAQLTGGEKGSDNQDITSQQPTDLYVNPGSPLLNSPGNLLSRFSVGFLPNPLSNLISPLPIIPSFDSSIQMANLNTKMYVAASIEGVNQTVYILLMDDGRDSNLSLEDILVKGIHCIKAKDASDAETSIKYGKDHYNLSLYLEINSGNPIWAWNEKWWQKGD